MKKKMLGFGGERKGKYRGNTKDCQGNAKQNTKEFGNGFEGNCKAKYARDSTDFEQNTKQNTKEILGFLVKYKAKYKGNY